MRKGKQTFDVVQLNRLREMSVPDALTQLGLYWKVDPDFQPIKNAKTKRLYVSVRSRVYELLVTDQKWYDARIDRGGGGCIDLIMHLLNVDFVHAVKALTAEVNGERHS